MKRSDILKFKHLFIEVLIDDFKVVFFLGGERQTSIAFFRSLDNRYRDLEISVSSPLEDVPLLAHLANDRLENPSIRERFLSDIVRYRLENGV
jgi:hypothetical protein